MRDRLHKIGTHSIVSEIGGILIRLEDRLAELVEGDVPLGANANELIYKELRQEVAKINWLWVELFRPDMPLYPYLSKEAMQLIKDIPEAVEEFFQTLEDEEKSDSS